MLPRDLKAEQFAEYPSGARMLVLAHLGALQQLPLCFLPSLLRELIDYDFKFPIERAAINKELINLSSLSPSQHKEWFQSFSQLSLSSRLEHLDWINQPAQFLEQLSAHLWTTHQQDEFTKAATVYGERLRSVVQPDPMPERRLGITVIGQGVASYDAPLFRKLRQHGTYFRRVKPENGLGLLLSAVDERARAHPVPYGHWYVDGGQSVYLASHQEPLLTCISYQALEPVRAALLRKLQLEIERPGMGPEELRTQMARLSPSELGMDKAGSAVLDRFQVKLFTEGSGTQIFSTTFAQWTAREVLRRAQPLTLLVRFAPRQQQKPMNELLSNGHNGPDLDPTGSLDLTGSLIDADMAAYYQWLNQQRLPGSEHSSFLVWFENHSQALIIAPSIPRGTESDSVVDLGQLLSFAVG